MLNGETVKVTRMQYQALVLLVEHAGEVVWRAALLTQIWMDMPEARQHAVDMCIRRLRKKLGI
jgi:DNA-binding response OmpR family regulator